MSLEDTVSHDASAVDLHVGVRIGLRRAALGMSLERLAEALGVSYQQVQKYERGMNRIGAGRLYRLSKMLDVPVSYFFEHIGASLDGGPRRSPGIGEDGADSKLEPMNRRETLELIRAYYRIRDRKVRKRLLELVRSLAAKLPS